MLMAGLLTYSVSGTFPWYSQW